MLRLHRPVETLDRNTRRYYPPSGASTLDGLWAGATGALLWFEGLRPGRPTQMDTLGTYVDLEIFYQYIWQEFEKYVEYRNNTVHLFIGAGMDEMLIVAPPDFNVQEKASPEHVSKAAVDWIA